MLNETELENLNSTSMVSSTENPDAITIGSIVMHAVMCLTFCASLIVLFLVFVIIYFDWESFDDIFGWRTYSMIEEE